MSISRGPTAAISQSSTATGSKSRNIMLPMRASPQLITGAPSVAGQWSSSHVEGALDERGARPVGHHPLVVRALLGQVAPQRGVAGTVELEEGDVVGGDVRAVQLGQDAHRRVLEPVLVGAATPRRATTRTGTA